jgi:two-component system cit operon sensor histidine kinase CitA
VIGIVSVGYLTSYLDSITLTKVINIFIAAVLLLIALFIFSWYFTRSIKSRFFARAAGNRPAGASAKGDDGVDL